MAQTTLHRALSKPDWECGEVWLLNPFLGPGAPVTVQKRDTGPTLRTCPAWVRRHMACFRRVENTAGVTRCAFRICGRARCVRETRVRQLPWRPAELLWIPGKHPMGLASIAANLVYRPVPRSIRWGDHPSLPTWSRPVPRSIRWGYLGAL